MGENPLEFVTDIRECFLREMKKPNILKIDEYYFSERRQLWGDFFWWLVEGVFLRQKRKGYPSLLGYPRVRTSLCASAYCRLAV